MIGTVVVALMLSLSLVGDPSSAEAAAARSHTPAPKPAVPEGPRPPRPSKTPKPRAKPGLAPATLDPSAVPQSSDRADELGLRRRADGTYLYVDPGAQFTAEFRSDGTVLFADRWRRPDPQHPEHGGGFALPPGGFGTSMNVTGPTEWLMYLQGDDPARRAKAELLKRTRPIRTRMAIAYHLNLIETRFGELRGQLRQVLDASDKTLGERRELLFQLWDDCDEAFAVNPGEIPAEAITVIDEARTQTAEKARRAIELFIRKRLPKRSRRAYTPHELEDMNQRRISLQPFAPYTPHIKAPPQPGTTP